MKCKKLIALALAGVMTLALAAPSFAADNATVITGMFKEITIDVVVPRTGSAVINPYSMPVKAVYGKDESGKELDAGNLSTAGAVSTQPLVAINKTDVALDVGATVTATVKGSLLLGKAAITDSTKTKTAVVYLETLNNAELDAAKQLDAGDILDEDAEDAKPICGMDGTKVVAAFNAWETTSYDFTTGAKNEGKVLAGATAVTKTKLCTLGAATIGVPEGGTEEVATPDASGFMLYRLGGDVVKNPSTAWNEKDGVSVNVAFSFSPTEAKEGGVIEESGTDPAAAISLTYTPDDDSIAFTDGDGASTVKWQLLSAGTTNYESIDASGSLVVAEGKTAAAGKIKVRATAVTAAGLKFYKEKEITLATSD